VADASGPRIALFTAGTVGAGHLMRALAIGRALARTGVHVQYRVIGPPLPFPVPAGLDYRAVPIDPLELLDPARAPRSELAAELLGFMPHRLVVDLFWAPLVRLLPMARCEAWLLVRRVPPDWFAGPPGVPFEPRMFARVLAIEPGVEGPIDETIDPVLVSNPDECRPRGALRERLGVDTYERLLVVHQAGKAGELDALLATVDAGERRVVRFGPSPQGFGEPFPLCEWLGDADALVSGAGYNAFWEAAWLGYASRSRFVPFPRDLDDQAWRVRTCAGRVPRSNGADVLARRLVEESG
jgi:hypothetical protein